MSTRAFQTILVASMGFKDRLQLESKVLAAALKQSHARGDASGVSLAHRQITILLRQQQAAEKAESSDSGDQTANRVEESQAPTGVSLSTSDDKGKKRKRVMPDIVWTEDESGSGGASEGAEPASKGAAAAEQASEPVAAPAQEVSADRAEEQPALTGSSPHSEDDKPNFDAYGILQVEQIASFEEIHRSFLYLVRRVLFGLKKAKRKQRRPLLDELQDLWIAHDILSDPVTRTDFDFRILGLRGAPDVIIHTAPEDKSDSISARTPLRIGELMQCAGLLEPTELEIAADMHKAMPEMLFGAFLVKQGFISEEDLGQVLTGQRLLKTGNITVGHYQMCMKRWRENQIPLDETAVSEGLVTQAEMDRIIAAGQRDTLTGVSAYPGAGSIRASAPIINAEEAAKRKVSAGNAVPQWKDQLDWSEPEEIQAYVDDEPDYQSRKPVESSLDIEGITDNVPKDSAGKKSLRRLMEGIHSPEQPNISEDGPSVKSLKSILSATSEMPARPQRLAGAGADKAKQEEPPIAENAKPIAELPPAERPRVQISFELEGDEEEPAEPSAETPAEQTAAPIVYGDAAEAPYAVSSETETTSEELAVSPAEALEATARPTIDVPVPKIVMQKRIEIDDDNVFGEVDYDDEDDAETDIDLILEGVEHRQKPAPAPRPSQEDTYLPDDGLRYDAHLDLEREETFSQPAAPAPVEQQEIPEPSDNATTSVEPETSIDDLLDFSTPSDADSGDDKSELTKVLDEAFHGARAPGAESDAPSIASTDLTAEAQFEPMSSDEGYMASGIYQAMPEAKPVAATPTREFSAPNQAPAPEPALAEATVEAIESSPVSPVEEQPQASSEPVSEPVPEPVQSVEPAPPEAVSEEPASAPLISEVSRTGAPPTPRQERTTGEISLSSSILESVDANKEETTLEMEAALAAIKSVEHLVHHHEHTEEAPTQKPADEAASSDSTSKAEEPAAPAHATVSMELPPVVQQAAAALSQTEDAQIEPTSENFEQGALETPSDAESSPATGEIVNPLTKITKTISESSAEKQSSDDAEIEETTDEIQVVKLTDVSAPSPSAVAKQSTPAAATETPPGAPTVVPAGSSADVNAGDNEQQRLKSGEWQIVYKLEGAIADVFMSEESEPEMPKLRPRLTEIDSIIPSSIAKMAKGGTTDGATADKDEDAKEDATKSGDSQSSDKPVIKPVSNNYYRDKGKQGDKGKSGDKSEHDGTNE